MLKGARLGEREGSRRFAVGPTRSSHRAPWTLGGRTTLYLSHGWGRHVQSFVACDSSTLLRRPGSQRRGFHLSGPWRDASWRRRNVRFHLDRIPTYSQGSCRTPITVSASSTSQTSNPEWCIADQPNPRVIGSANLSHAALGAQQKAS